VLAPPPSRAARLRAALARAWAALADWAALVRLGRAGRLDRLAWPGTLLGRARAVGRAGLLPTVGPGWFKKEKPFLLY